jgi:excisionase family DNA binding protein
MGSGQRCGSQRLVQDLRIAPLADVNPRRSITALSKRIHIDFEAPPELIEAIAERVVELLAPRLDAPGEWLTAAEAAEYLRCPLSRIYALSSAERIPLHHDGSRLLFRRSELDTWVNAGGGKRFG